MLEDIARNLEPAHALGMTTVWVRSEHDHSAMGADGDHVHHVIDDLVAWLDAQIEGARLSRDRPHPSAQRQLAKTRFRR